MADAVAQLPVGVGVGVEQSKLGNQSPSYPSWTSHFIININKFTSGKNYDLEAAQKAAKELERHYDAQEKKAAEVLKLRREGHPPPEISIDLTSDKEVNNLYYKEVKNLLWIENSLVYKKALEEWERKEALLISRVERKRSKVESRKTEIYQLIGFFSVFQGVLLTAVSQSNLLHQNNAWSPIYLSLLAAIVTFAGCIQKFNQIEALQKTISGEAQSHKEAVKINGELRRLGKEFRFSNFPGDRKVEQKQQFTLFGYSSYSISVLVFLGLFTAGFILSHWRILYHPGPNPYPGSSSGP